MRNSTWLVFALLAYPTMVRGSSSTATTSGAVPLLEENKEKTEAIESLDLAELLSFPIDYGMENVRVEHHLYLTAALWNLQEQASGSFADKGSSLAGRPVFISYSGYIDLRGYLLDTIMAEAEFELYKGQKGEFKVTRLRGVWKPNAFFQLAIGRDFPPIGVQDKVYYPTSQFRLFTHAPYLYHAIIRATGWWDSGIHVSASAPLPFLHRQAKIGIDASIINGPGDEHRDEDYLVNHMKPNDGGYMFEAFHDKARQPWDNNTHKPVPVRIWISPLPDLELGVSAMFAKYDDREEYEARYKFAHLLYRGERLTIAAEFGQLEIDVDPSNMQAELNHENGTLNNKTVTQRSLYVSVGYRIINEQFGIHYVEPVVRYEMMDSWAEDDTDKGDRHLLLAGIRVAPVRGWTLKASYLYQRETAEKLKNNGAFLETVFEF